MMVSTTYITCECDGCGIGFGQSAPTIPDQRKLLEAKKWIYNKAGKAICSDCIRKAEIVQDVIEDTEHADL